MTPIRSFLLLLLMTAGLSSAQEAPRAGNPHGPMDLDCVLCHDEGSWQISGRPDGFDHATTGFPLVGRHAEAHCRDCHEDPRFAFVGTSCADCHADIHKGRLGPDCQQCHTPEAWVQRSEQRVAHDATSFPLVGAHDRVDCDACHTGPLAGDYVGTPTDCYFCHAETYAATMNPDHQTAGFGTDCQECHSPYSSTWGSGDFSHPASFPLTGAHGRLECTACHVGGFTGAVTDCYACHQDDFEGTNDPDHVGAGFPVTCAICHTTTAWEPSSWDHDTLFPIYTGRHRSEWDSCVDCHVVPSNYVVFECIFCHEHNRSDTDQQHQEEGNDYQYNSLACFDCHPRGEAED